MPTDREEEEVVTLEEEQHSSEENDYRSRTLPTVRPVGG
jgi:hypothetical protein